MAHTTRLRTIAACHESAARDMLDRVLPPIAPPVDCTRFPNIAAARAHLASLSPERRAELEKELM